MEDPRGGSPALEGVYKNCRMKATVNPVALASDALSSACGDACIGVPRGARISPHTEQAGLDRGLQRDGKEHR